MRYRLTFSRRERWTHSFVVKDSYMAKLHLDSAGNMIIQVVGSAGVSNKSMKRLAERFNKLGKMKLRSFSVVVERTNDPYCKETETEQWRQVIKYVKGEGLRRVEKWKNSTCPVRRALAA